MRRTFTACLQRELENFQRFDSDSTLAVVEETPAVKGAWQRKIARLPGLSLEQGMTAGEVAREVAYDEANTYTVLNALEKGELVEQIICSSPKRWRLAVKHRRDRILRASRVIRDGEWTTYGDIAIAVSDSVRLARTIGRVAAKNPAFANPHRVLKTSGVAPPDWRDDDGRGPEECERPLREEGVTFDAGGHASTSAPIGCEGSSRASPCFTTRKTPTCRRRPRASRCRSRITG